MISKLMLRYHNIPFDQRDSISGPRHGLYLPGNYWVPKRYFDLMWQAANANWETLNWSEKQSAESIFGGKDKWLAHKVGGRIALGRCLKYFADNLLLPIAVANPGKKGKRFYKRMG